jgi:hypothetical protein
MSVSWLGRGTIWLWLEGTLGGTSVESAKSGLFLGLSSVILVPGSILCVLNRQLK